MIKPTVSIIIPAFNAQRTIVRAIDSLVNQTYDGQIEIIVINDGSTDDTKAQLESYQFTHALRKLRVCHQSNNGVSWARNKGIELALNEYLVFLDADDFYLEDAITHFMDRVSKTQCDFLISPVELMAVDEVITRSELKERFYPLFLTGIMNSPCGKVFKTESLKRQGILFNLAFSMGEDLLFNMEVYFKAEKIAILSYDGYCYDRGSSTLTGSFRENYFEERLKVLATFKDILSNQEIVFEDEAWFHVKLCYSVFLKYINATGKKTLKQKIQFIKGIQRHDKIKQILNDFKSKDKMRMISGKILKWSPSWLLAFCITLLPYLKKIASKKSSGASI